MDCLAKIEIFHEYAVVTTASDEPQRITTKSVAIEDLTSAFSGAPVTTGLLPQRTLWYRKMEGVESIGVWAPPQRYRLMASRRTYEIPLPGFVFYGKGSRYKVFAVKGNERPSERSRLYWAPLPNVINASGVCSGNMTLPTCGAETIWQAWKMIMHDSYFTGHMVAGRCQSYKNIFDLWAALDEGGQSWFPEDELRPYRLGGVSTVRQLVEE